MKQNDPTIRFHVNNLTPGHNNTYFTVRKLTFEITSIPNNHEQVRGNYKSVTTARNEEKVI